MCFQIGELVVNKTQILQYGEAIMKETGTRAVGGGSEGDRYS
jgi:hypothetical protein